MITKVHMEALSPTMEEGQIVRWLKSEGEDVANGDILAEIETDKATMELVARGDGVLRVVMLPEGGTAPVGEVIAVIADADEDISEFQGQGGPADEAGAEEGGEDAGDAAPAEGAADAQDADGGAEETQPAPAPAADEAPEGRVKASPLARRLAEEAGLDLSAIPGSGPGGRVVKRDVEEAREGAASAPSAPREAPASPERPAAPAPEAWADAGASEGYVEVKVSQMRKTIAKRLTESLSPVPHFFLTIEVDMSRVLEARKTINEVVEKDGDRISVNDFIIKAAAGALRRHPSCNAAWHGDTIRRFDHVHVGVAVAVEDGLITPVVKHADRKGLVQISREVKELAGRARKKRLQPDEYTGSTFSISNLGMFGIREFTAIINPPEAGILAIGETKEIPVAVDGEVVVRPRMRVTMSCDHRVIDGATGAAFMATLKAMLEEPSAILL
ncbi:MAG TPA: pyruvate dehydrogenase complex dihydrolipoamide acetyltransferase [Longimicrobiales bacterium]|nr:pyruvate dehydrogenase complex dihydrolipoamide acetyltransferase [Longimicrobiales bacterium]